MSSLFDHQCRCGSKQTDASRSELSRRVFLGGTIGSLLSIVLAPWEQVLALNGGKNAGGDPSKPARNLIILWLRGGPSHIDTFDPKEHPQTGGPFKSIPTSVKGVRFCEHLPRIAENAHKIAVIRSMTSSESSHFRGRYQAQTGYMSEGALRHPVFGSVVSKVLGDPSEALPSFVTVGGSSFGPGFLGESFAPFQINEAGVAIENLAPPAGVDPGRFERRLKLVTNLERGFGSRGEHPAARNLADLRKRAVALMTSPKMDVFDLSGVPRELRAAYGLNPFGQGCLLARRLVEQGVRCVEVTCDGWDTHVDNFGGHRESLEIFDPAFAALLADLERRELLDSTLVLAMGEFGRTPKINPREGRDHYPDAFFSVLAGSGIRPGIVHGATDDEGAQVVKDPVTVPDLVATLCKRLGINPRSANETLGGRPVKISEGTPIQSVLQS